VIRRATDADVESLGALWAESARSAFTPFLPEGHRLPDPQPQRMRDRIAGGDVSVLVADEDGEVAGFVACGVSRDADAGPGTGEVQAFFVGAGRWRRGIGRGLMAAALADLSERGYTAAIVWSFADNERANAFYERHGFSRDGTTRTEEVWAHLPEVRYRRTLP
jgi:ribosomal protein S18 acetylase RimI-like enzyme